MDFDDLLLSPLYADPHLATDAVLTTASSIGPVELRAIDKTAGVSVSSGEQSDLTMQTLRPGADVRVKDLLAAGIELADLRGGTLELNGTTWKIHSHLKRPGPQGAGEVRLFLMDQG